MLLIPSLLLSLSACATGDHAAPVAPQSPVEATLPLADSGERVRWANPAWSAPAGADAPEVARAWVEELGASRGLPRTLLEGFEVSREQQVGKAGARLVELERQAMGRPVRESRVVVLLDPDLRPVAASWGRAWEQPATGTRDARFVLGPDEAVLEGLSWLSDQDLPLYAVRLGATDSAGWERASLDPAAPLRLEEARLRQVFQPAADALIPAWELELMLDGPGGLEAWLLVLDARDGALLERRSLTAADSFSYRVWADEDGRPLDGPFADLSPHPSGSPDDHESALTEAILVSVEGLNLNPDGGSDPWLPAGATQTDGNNALAYADLAAPSGLADGDLLPETSSAGSFDYAYDFSVDPSTDTGLASAGAVQAFYTVNWLHDWWYDSGFDEPARNGQQDNYERGGAGEDPLLIEVLDFDGRNNAKMSTPGDGSSPRMQMYAWTGLTDQYAEVDSLGARYETGVASFGPSSFDVTGELSIPDDIYACSALSKDLTGTIALIARGTCNFTDKVAAVEDVGAIGALIYNSSGGTMSMGGSGASLLPTLSLSAADGATLAANEGVEVRLFRNSGVLVDGGLDNTVVAHEWGHYLHNRLTSTGSMQSRGMGEGWADFVALHLVAREGDDLDGAWPVASYATQGLASDPYYGIRRAPYSVNPDINALSFRHVSDGEPLPTHPLSLNSGSNSEVHNAGEVWASAMWELYVALQDYHSGGGGETRDFDTVRRDMSDYVVVGMQLTPDSATFTEARDALLAAIAALDPDDLQPAAEAFARRGLGSCAVSPERDSTDLVGVVESFELSTRFAVGSPRLDDGGRSCDGDGVLDFGETGRLVVPVTNAGPVPLSGATLEVVGGSGYLRFPEGPSLELPDIPAMSTVEVSLAATLAEDAPAFALADVEVLVRQEDACEPELGASGSSWVDLDERPERSPVDDFDAEDSPWSISGDGNWTRIELGPGDLYWWGSAPAGVTDAALETPPMRVADKADFTLSLDHRYAFEQSGGVWWDGSVIELSVDGGDWEDISGWTDPGYDGVLSDLADNPLGGRAAFSGASAGYPDLGTLRLDLGQALAGHEVQVRFRIGTDQAAGEAGWEITRVQVGGVSGLPFPERIEDATVCNEPPVAEAGEDQAAMGLEAVRLDGSASTDPEGDPLSYSWVQLSGSLVVLDDPSSATPGFVAPDEDAVLDFELTVDDGELSATDTVTVTLTAQPEPEDTSPPDPGPDDPPVIEDEPRFGCTSAPASPGRWGLLLLALGGLLRRRR